MPHHTARSQRTAMVRAAVVLAACVVAAPAVTAPASARQSEEIVVTASRYTQRFEETTIPAVTLTRRADAVVQTVIVESDSRDAAQRRTELTQALTDIAQRARGNTMVTVSLVQDDAQDAGDTSLVPFSLEAALETIGSGNRADTSRVQIMLRTAVTPDDTLRTAGKRLSDFMRAAPRPGRVTLMPGNASLTLINPSQYRPAVVAAVMENGKAALALAGPDHALLVSGLEKRLAWRQAGDLAMTLYIPYSLAIGQSR